MYSSDQIFAGSTTNDESSQNTLFIPFLGQSNAQHMSYIFEPYQPESIANKNSGAIVFKQKLTTFTDQAIVTSDTLENNFAVGSSKVNGNSYFVPDDIVWWYPDISHPGGALRQAESRLQEWLSIQEAEANDPVARDKYKQSTLAVFDYLTSSLDYANIKFYIVPTGRLQAYGARNSGLSEENIAVMNEGLQVIREVQGEIALARDDVLLAPDYSDLNMVYEEGELYRESYDQNQSEWSSDFWHLGHDGLKVNGDRLAQYIALDQGENNVISFTDSFGNPAESTSLTRDGILDINVAETSSQEIIQGTDNPDVIVGTLQGDKIIGGAGNDLIMASQGMDTLIGEAGNDIFFFDSVVYPDIAVHSDQILDFEINQDRLDVSELLKLTNNSLASTIATEYIIITPLGANSIELQFDQDGVGQGESVPFAILENIDPLGFISNIGNHLIVSPIEL